MCILAFWRGHYLIVINPFSRLESLLFSISVKHFQSRVARFVTALWAYIMLGDFNETFAQQLHSDFGKRL
jgi:hypothetical protein